MAKYQFSVHVIPRYLPDRSSPEDGQYLFAYTIRIENSGEVPARLHARHWIITDSNGRVEDVRGEGVVGEKPHLAPGQSFEYTSGCPLETPVGTMRGTFSCRADDGTEFEVPVPEFVLSVPRVLH